MRIDTHNLWRKAVDVAADNGMRLPATPQSVGAWHRVPGAGKNDRNAAGAYMCQSECVHVIDHSSGWSCTVFADNDTTGNDRAETHRGYVVAERERLAKQKAGVKTALRRLEWQWRNASLCRSTRYTARKQIQTYGSRYVYREQYLLVLLHDINGNLQSAQRIYDNGSKKAWPGLPISGAFHLLGNVMVSKRLLLCEGFATGCTLHEETGLPVACAMFANNLKAVAVALRTRYQRTSITICGDDDTATKDNVGRVKATAAADSIGAALTFPVFPEGVSGSDFNDLHLALQAVAI